MSKTTDVAQNSFMLRPSALSFRGSSANLPRCGLLTKELSSSHSFGQSWQKFQNRSVATKFPTKLVFETWDDSHLNLQDEIVEIVLPRSFRISFHALQSSKWNICWRQVVRLNAWRNCCIAASHLRGLNPNIIQTSIPYITSSPSEHDRYLSSTDTAKSSESYQAYWQQRVLGSHPVAKKS